MSVYSADSNGVSRAEHAGLVRVCQVSVGVVSNPRPATSCSQSCGQGVGNVEKWSSFPQHPSTTLVFPQFGDTSSESSITSSREERESSVAKPTHIRDRPARGVYLLVLQLSTAAAKSAWVLGSACLSKTGLGGRIEESYYSPRRVMVRATVLSARLASIRCIRCTDSS